MRAQAMHSAERNGTKAGALIQGLRLGAGTHFVLTGAKSALIGLARREDRAGMARRP